MTAEVYIKDKILIHEHRLNSKKGERYTYLFIPITTVATAQEGL